MISNVATAGNWLLLTFGSTTGTRVRLAFGAGSGVANGGSIPLPTGFSTSQLIAHASIDSLATTASNQLDHFAVSVTAGTISATASDDSGNNFTPTAAWCAVATGLLPRQKATESRENAIIFFIILHSGTVRTAMLILRIGKSILLKGHSRIRPSVKYTISRIGLDDQYLREASVICGYTQDGPSY